MNAERGRERQTGQEKCVLVCGTLAYDHIGVVDGAFGANNVKLAAMQRHFGGCGGNLAYNLALLGQCHALYALAGQDDIAPYQAHLSAAGADTAHLKLGDAPTAQAFVFTARSGEQFTAFQPHDAPLEIYATALQETLASVQPALTVVAPDQPPLMAHALEHAAQFGPTIWCPGQYAELLQPEDVSAMARYASVIVVNAAERQALGAAHCDTWVITNGGRPVVIQDGGQQREVQVPRSGKITDPTGCGDAFAAALAAAYAADLPLDAAAEHGITLAQRCLACDGSQNHSLERRTDV